MKSSETVRKEAWLCVHDTCNSLPFYGAIARPDAVYSVAGQVNCLSR
jgi:hypothetical protein